MKYNYPIKTILDTDIGGDVDDSAAVAMLNIWHDQGLVDLLAVVSCITSRWSAGAIDCINNYYGHPWVPVGIYKEPGLLDNELANAYTRYLTQHFPNRYRDFDAEDAVSVYRRVLAAQPDNSVQIISIGMFATVAELLKSGPDIYSELNGIELVKKKVFRLVSMAGIFVDYFYCDVDWCSIDVEWNIDMHVESARYVAENWPVDMVWSGFETGGNVMTGKLLIDTAPEGHPVATAYKMFTRGIDRISCDLATLHFAVLGTDAYWDLSDGGRVLVDSYGYTKWVSSDTAKNHRYLIRKVPEKFIKDEVDRIMVVPSRALNISNTKEGA